MLPQVAPPAGTSRPLMAVAGTTISATEFGTLYGASQFEPFDQSVSTVPFQILAANEDCEITFRQRKIRIKIDIFLFLDNKYRK